MNPETATGTAAQAGTHRPLTPPRAADAFRAGDTVRRWIGFELSGQRYGVPILSVQEVLAQAEIEPVPGTASQILGVINLRGQIVTVIDLRRRLGLSPAASEAGPLIVFDTGGEILAARVDRVTQVTQIADSAIRPAPATGPVRTAAVQGLVARDAGLMTLLDVPALLA